MMRLKLFREPRAMLGFVLTPPLTAGLPAMFMGAGTWMPLTCFGYLAAILVGLPIYEWLRDRVKPGFLLVIGLGSACSALSMVAALALRTATRAEAVRAEPTLAVLFGGIYVGGAMMWGAVGGCLFWLIAFARTPNSQADRDDGAST
jgi:ABC-type amino acid transport system permease subunit